MNEETTPTETADGAGIESELEAMRAELQGARGAERAAIARLREALLQTEPALEATMLAGETLGEVEANFASATAMLARLRERAALEALARVPAGAPGRGTAIPRSAFEKIRDGLGKAG